MTTTINPKPVNPELIKFIDEWVYEAVYNYLEVLEEISTLPAMRKFRPQDQHLLDGLTIRDYQVLIDAAVDRQRAEHLFRFGLLDDLQKAAHSAKKKHEMESDAN